MTPTEPASKGPDELSLDPFVAIEQIRSNPHFGAEDLAKINDVHEAFVRVGSFHADNEQFCEALKLAYIYGTMIGAYTATSDPDMLVKVTSLQQASRAQSPRPREWHRLAAELAVSLRRENPRLSQEQLAEKIRRLLSPAVNPPGVETITDYVSTLEREGKCPKMRRGQTFLGG
jgi:hypothetical protein